MFYFFAFAMMEARMAIMGETTGGISSTAAFARVGSFGFYRVVDLIWNFRNRRANWRNIGA